MSINSLTVVGAFYLIPYSKTIRSEHLIPLQLVDILAYMKLRKKMIFLYVHKPMERNIFECF